MPGQSRLQPERWCSLKLLTKEILGKLPALYATEDTPTKDKTIAVKFFTPDSNWTWYAVEGSPVDAEGLALTGPGASGDTSTAVDFLFFGLVDGFVREWGYFSLNELMGVKGSLGLPIERDMHFGTPTVGSKGFA